MARNELPLPKIPGIYQSYMEIKDKYPIGSEMQTIDNVRFIECPEKKKSHQLCDPNVALMLQDKDLDAANKRNWMVFDDKEVLTFTAYFKHPPRFAASSVEYDIRVLKIIYFLVDETIEVNEPLQKNSGSPQGCMIRRQRIPLPGCDRDRGPFYRLPDLTVGGKVVFYGKTLCITGVDAFTRDSLVKMGVEVPDNEPVPDDPYFVFRKNYNLDHTPTCKPSWHRDQSDNGYNTFVLRFRGYWDNRYEEGGDLHFCNVLYHLTDDTIEVTKEYIDDNDPSGKIHHVLFVNRQKLPNKTPWLKFPGHDQKRGLLNIITKKKSKYYKMDNQPLTGDAEPYYKCTDLFIGATLNVFNRAIVLVECDEFTQAFYKNVYGLNDFSPIERPKTLREIKEDELREKRVETILKSMNEVTRKALISEEGAGTIFVFLIKMITDDLEDKKRNFLLKYYLDDTKFSVYEFRLPSSGLRGGMFRYRRKLRKDQDEKKIFVFHQLYVGAVICFDEFEFTLTDVENRTLRFMIKRPKEFPHSNLETVIKKAREVINKRFSSLEEFRTENFQERALVDREEFRKIMSFEGALDAHAVAVLALVHQRPDPFEPYSDLTFKSVVQDALRRALFIHFDGLKNNLRLRKSTADQEGFVGREEAIKAIKSNKVPLSGEIINKLLDRFTDAELGLVNYVEMVDFIDYIKYPTDPPAGLARELLFDKPNKVLVKVDELVNTLRTEEA